VAAAISENETLPDSERLPEPYFARAEIWATAGNYSDSLQDYLYGISIVRVSARDLLSYSVQFDKLGDVADKLQKMPVPAAGAEPIYSSAAREHYSLGYGLFFRDDLRAALEHFDSAVQLAPDQPLYWYFRALTYHGLGDEQRAQHDALMGAFFERELAAWYRRSLHRAFIRIQGARRAWLESYRLGSPTPRLVAQP
jgi:tetratricopeptide (TPR) repeat protein